MAKFNRRKAKSTDAQCGPLPKYFGRGANIRIVTPDGTVVQSDPRVYKGMSKAERNTLCDSILSAC
jgi:hypothetical protein